MEKVYQYSAITNSGKNIINEVLAESKNEAYDKLISLNINKISSVNLNISKTLNLSKKISLKELSRFYDIMAKKMANGSNPISGLDSAINITNDVRLKTSINTLKMAMEDGKTMGDAMIVSGFPERHAKAVIAMGASGKIHFAFSSLALECKRTFETSKKFNKMLRMPKIIFIIFAFMLYGFFAYMGPKLFNGLVKVLKYEEMPSITQKTIDVVNGFSNNLFFSSFIFILFFSGIIIFSKSKYFGIIVDQIKIFKEISEKTDQADAWQRFSLMFSASINQREICKMIAESAIREDTKRSFLMMESYLQQGYSVLKAVKRSNFPEYTIKAVEMGESTEGELAETLDSFAKDLFLDVEYAIEKSQENVSLIITLAMFGVAFLFFLLTVYPIMSAVTSKM